MGCWSKPGTTCEQQAQLDTVRQLRTLVKSVVGVGQSALQFEALRTNITEARAGDHQFLGILACCRDSSLAKYKYRDRN